MIITGLQSARNVLWLSCGWIQLRGRGDVMLDGGGWCGIAPLQFSPINVYSSPYLLPPTETVLLLWHAVGLPPVVLSPTGGIIRSVSSSIGTITFTHHIDMT